MLPPLDPAVKLIVAEPFPALAVKEVGAEGVVAGVAETEEEAELSPWELTAFK